MDLLFLPLMFGVLYFVVLRPQKKRQQEMAQMLASLVEGADVITVGGIYGTIVAIDDEHLDLQVTAEGTVLRFRRDAIARIERDEDLEASHDSADSADGEDSADAPATLAAPDPTVDDVIKDDLSDRA